MYNVYLKKALGALPLADLFSSQDLEGVHDLLRGVLVNSLLGHEINKCFKGDVASLVRINISPDLVKHRIICLFTNNDKYSVKIKHAN